MFARLYQNIVIEKPKLILSILILSLIVFGYYTKGESIEVGTSSTQAVVTSSVGILIANFLLTQMILF